MRDDSDYVFISCLGRDGKIHACRTYETLTACGKTVKSKIVTPRDFKSRFSCYECTAKLEEMEDSNDRET